MSSPLKQIQPGEYISPIAIPLFFNSLFLGICGTISTVAAASTYESCSSPLVSGPITLVYAVTSLIWACYELHRQFLYNRSTHAHANTLPPKINRVLYCFFTASLFLVQILAVSLIHSSQCNRIGDYWINLGYVELVVVGVTTLTNFVWIHKAREKDPEYLLCSIPTQWLNIISLCHVFSILTSPFILVHLFRFILGVNVYAEPPPPAYQTQTNNDNTQDNYYGSNINNYNHGGYNQEGQDSYIAPPLDKL